MESQEADPELGQNSVLSDAVNKLCILSIVLREKINKKEIHCLTALEIPASVFKG